MTFRPRRTSWLRLGLLVLSPLALPGTARYASAEEVTVAEPAVRYPFDPVCPWGRVSDGRGLLVRCLESAEAQRLATAARVTPAPVGAPATLLPAAAPGRIPALAPPSTPPLEARAAPTMVAPPLAASVFVAGSPAALPLAAPAGKPRKVALKAVSAARADTGELPEARTQLLRAGDRYVQCVASNGGISSSPARVTVRFLVRERGRAEGVTVKEREGMSMAAAKCVATVVDRRYVGYPAAPIVGADLSVDFAWEGAGR